MGRQGRGGGRGRGGSGGGSHGIQEHGDGSSGRGRGKSCGRGRGKSCGRGGGRGREGRQSGQGGVPQTGFVAGGALIDWEATTPLNRAGSTGRRGRTHEGLAGGSKQPNSHGRQGVGGREQVMKNRKNPLSSVSFFYENICAATGRRGRTHEGLAGGSKQPSSHGRQGLGGREQVMRSAENPSSSVNFSYENSNSRNEKSTRTSRPILQLAKEERAAGPREMEVVVPAIEGRIEVYVDRGHHQKALEPVDIEMRTTGLGFVDNGNHASESRDSRSTVAAEISESGKESDRAVTEAMYVETGQTNYLEVKTLEFERSNRPIRRNKKERDLGITTERSSGFLSIGGVRIWTDKGSADENEELDKEPDVSLALDFASGKKQWGSGSKNSKSKRKKDPGRKSGAQQRGQWLQNASSDSGESILDSSNSEIDDEMAEDYLANVGIDGGSLDATWLLRDKLFEQVPIEDMVIQGGEDDTDSSTDSSAKSGGDSGSNDYASPERVWRIRRQMKGKEVMETDDNSDSELEDMAEKLLFEGAFTDSVDAKGGRDTGPALRIRDLDLDDSLSEDYDSEDEDDVDQLFELLEDANFMPDKSPKTPATGKQSRSGDGISSQPGTRPMSVHKSKKKSKSVPGEKKRQRKKMIGTWPMSVHKSKKKSKSIPGEKKRQRKKTIGTWPMSVHKSKKKSKSVPGEKKRQRKKMIGTWPMSVHKSKKKSKSVPGEKKCERKEMIGTSPMSVHKSKKKSKSVPGEKKRERKEMIAAKRRERAIIRGLDLQAINKALEEIVVRGTDIYAFAPMEDRDRAQIHKMAGMYRLKSASQGSGKKRFTVVTRTRHTSLPMGADKYCLASMLCQGGANTMVHSSDRALTGEDRRMAKKFNKAAREAFISMQGPNLKGSGRKHQKIMQFEGSSHKSRSKRDLSGHGQASKERSGGGKSRTAKYANKPMSFVSSGIIGNDEEISSPGLEATTIITTEVDTFSIDDTGETSISKSATGVKLNTTTTVPVPIGTFEAHTRGFGSRMMSKMGFVEGQGLGRDGQGIAYPLEAVKRPKSLGLGAYAPPPTT